MTIERARKTIVNWTRHALRVEPIMRRGNDANHDFTDAPAEAHTLKPGASAVFALPDAWPGQLPLLNGLRFLAEEPVAQRVDARIKAAGDELCTLLNTHDTLYILSPGFTPTSCRLIEGHNTGPRQPPEFVVHDAIDPVTLRVLPIKHLVMVVDSVGTDAATGMKCPRMPAKVPNPSPEWRVSASSEFTAGALQAMLTDPKFLSDRGRLVVVDLRQEPHAVVGKATVTWVEPGDERDHGLLGLQEDHERPTEKRFVEALRDALAAKATVPAYKPLDKNGRLPLELKPHKPLEGAVQTEGELVTRANAVYLRIPVPDHAMPETDADVETFVRRVREEQAVLGEKRPWFHFHCRGGRGRTTTFVALFDALCHARTSGMSWTDLVTRQKDDGGVGSSGLSAVGLQEGRDRLQGRAGAGSGALPQELLLLRPRGQRLLGAVGHGEQCPDRRHAALAGEAGDLPRCHAPGRPGGAATSFRRRSGAHSRVPVGSVPRDTNAR